MSGLHSALGLLVDHWPVVQMSGFNVLQGLYLQVHLLHSYSCLRNTRYTFFGGTKDKELLLTEG